MPKEMIVVSSSHETKIAILEDDQVAEVYFEREKEYSLAGSIYKGRVTRVLPGMQSAFVDIGLERDAFLYVSDFFEETEEYDKIASTVEEKVIKIEKRLGEEAGAESPKASLSTRGGEAESGTAGESSPGEPPSEEASPAKAPLSGERPNHSSHRSRRRRFWHKGFPESKYASSAPPSAASAPTVLPGESLAKYRGLQVGSSLPPSEDQESGLQEARPAGESPAAQAIEAGPVAGESPAAEISLAEKPRAEQAVKTEPVAGESPAEEPQAEYSPSLAEAPSVESSLPESLVPQTPEEGEKFGTASGNGGGERIEEETQAPQQATVRETHQNARYLRKSRWMARKEAQAAASGRGRRPKEQEAAKPLIAELLKEGQEIIVQIAKEPLGKKGARITSHIALPGRYLVYMPTVDHVGISRKIASERERQRLKRIILENNRNIPGGFIVRTAGEGRSEEDFRQDILFLSNLWSEIKLQVEKGPAPALLHHDWNLVLRTLRDQLSEDFSAIWVDNEQEYEGILDLVSKFQPSLVNRVKLYTKDVPLFEELGIQEEINKALKPKVWLKSGGYIVINQTEALVAIDVNTGKFVGKSNRLEDTIVKTNIEAIQEIVRQIRLRDLGGIIVIDFIDMDERKNRQKVMAALEEALKEDRAPSKILSFNEFGLVAITRKRVRQSLERTLCQPCPYCNGSALVKSAATVCYEILSEARKLVSQLERKQIRLRVNPEVGRVLKARDNTILREIEEMTHKDVFIRNDPSLHLESFDFD